MGKNKKPQPKRTVDPARVAAITAALAKQGRDGAAQRAVDRAADAATAAAQLEATQKNTGLLNKMKEEGIDKTTKGEK